MSPKLASTTTLVGHGLHSGAPCRVALRRLERGAGIVFKRLDIEGAPPIAATVESVLSTERCTRLGDRWSAIGTVEHLLAALVMAGWWDTLVEVDGPEVPILDGSALPFSLALSRPRREGRKPATLTERLVVEHGESRATATPAEGFSLHCEIEFPHPAIGRQELLWSGGPESFRSEIAPARTFGFLTELAQLRERGLIKGGSLDCALVFDDLGPLQELRFPDEPVRHKLLDAIGDLALVGAPFAAAINLVRPSHELVVELAWKLWRSLGGRRTRGGTRG